MDADTGSFKAEAPAAVPPAAASRAEIDAVASATQRPWR